MATKAERKRQRNAEREKVHRALSHELRVEIHVYLIEHSTGSPSEMAKALGATVQDVTYHARQLVRYGLAELLEEQPTRRGTPKRIYRPIARPLITTEEAEEMSPAGRHSFAGQNIQAAFDDVIEAGDGHAFANRSDWHLTRVPLNLDNEGWAELLAAHARLLEETYEIQARSDGRRPKSEEEPRRVSTSQLCFVMS